MSLSLLDWLTDRKRKAPSAKIFPAIGALVIGLTSGIMSLVEQRYDIGFDADHFVVTVVRKNNQDLPAKIKTLTTSLNSAAETIGQIEQEIRKRQELVRQLETEADTASKVAALNKEQLDAVAQVLRGEIRSDERQNFWSAQLLAFFYAALGVALSEGYRFLLRWRIKRRSTAEGSVKP